MNNSKNQFNIGDIVTFRNHPLLYHPEIKGDSKYVPPLMIIKEIFFEENQKKTHDDVTGKRIAEKIKYICVYFDDNRSEFVENHLYEGMLQSIHNLHIGYLEDEVEIPTQVVNEILSYDPSPSYEYGKIIHFKTKKLEVLKRRSSKTVSKISEKTKEKQTKRKIFQHVVNYASPEFIISGFKKESYTDLFFKDGKTKRMASTDLVKIQWYNPIHQKFSEQFLPLECFTDKPLFKTRLPHHKTHLIIPEPAVEHITAPIEKTPPEVGDKSNN